MEYCVFIVCRFQLFLIVPGFRNGKCSHFGTTFSAHNHTIQLRAMFQEVYFHSGSVHRFRVEFEFKRTGNVGASNQSRPHRLIAQEKEL